VGDALQGQCTVERKKKNNRKEKGKGNRRAPNEQSSRREKKDPCGLFSVWLGPIPTQALPHRPTIGPTSERKKGG